MPVLPITKWGGMNAHDQADTVWERSHAPSANGFSQLPGVGAELSDTANLDYSQRGIRQRKGSELDQTITLAGGWTKTGNDLNILTAGIPALATLSTTRVAFIDATNADFRAYDFDGTNWAQVGNDLNIGVLGGSVALAALNSTDVAYIDIVNEDLRTYRFDGTNWAQVGNDLNIGVLTAPVALAALNSTDVAYIDGTNEDLRTYRFDGTNWAQVGNDLNIGGVIFPALAALNSTDVAFIHSTNNQLRTYRFDGTNWAQVGNSLLLDAFSNSALTAFSSTDVVFIDVDNDDLRVYRFDGTNWNEVGTELNITTVGIPAIAALTSSSIAFIDSTNDDLRTYRLAEAGQVIAGTEWTVPSTGQRVQVDVTGSTIFTDQSGAMTQVNDSTGAPFIFDSAVSKVTFAEVDGHLFIFTDGANNNIQAYISGANLEPEMKSGNTYNDAYGVGTHTITGTWPTGAYLGVGINSRLAFSDGNTLIEYTPMAHTTNSGVWDLLGSTAGAFHAKGNIVMMTNFVPHLSNSIEETLFIGTRGGSGGFEVTTGFQSFDRLIALEGSQAPMNHKAFFKSRNWIAYIAEDGTIRGVNRQGYINLGRRFSNPEGTGPLDALVATDSIANSFGFYNSAKEQGILAISTATGRVNDTWLVLDFNQGEPVPGEPEPSFERRVRALVWKISKPDANPWFFDVYRKQSGIVGVLKSGALYDMEVGNNDLGSIAIEAHGTLSVFTGGNEITSNLMQWKRAEMRSVPTADDTNTITLDVFIDYSTTVSKTFTKAQKATVGNIVKASHQLNLRTEAIQLKLSNTALNETFTLSTLALFYELGQEIKAA